jgi:hypothetical protein
MEKTMRRTISIWLGFLSFALLSTFAQVPATMGKIHGRVTDPLGIATTSGTVSLSTDGGQSFAYTFPVSSIGVYGGIAAPGTYTVIYRQLDTPKGNKVDSIDDVNVVAGQDVLQDIDMTRKQFIDKLAPEQKKSLEDIKAHNAEVLKSNEIITTMNADLRICRQDIKDGDSALDAGTKAAKYSEAETLMLKDTQAKPDSSVLWTQLGQAQAGLMKYSEAESSFMKAIELENSAKYPNSQTQSLANSELAKIRAHTGIVAVTNTASSGSVKMTNNEVIQLVTAGLSDQVVANSIRQASNKDFDLTISALIALKKAGVSDAVITAMQESGTSTPASRSEAPPEPPRAITTPPASPCADIDYLGVIQAVTGGGMMAGSNAYGGRIRNRATYTKEVDFAWVMNGRAETGTFRVPAGQFIDVNLGVGSSPPTNVKVVTCR